MENLILRKKPELIQWLCSDFVIVLQYVQSKELVTTSQYKDLMKMKEMNGVIHLLDIITGRGENVCREFLKMLKNDKVNEISPELRDWIKTVDTEETTKMTGQSGTHVTCQISSTGGNVGPPDVPKNYQKPVRDCQHMPIQNYQKFLKENTSVLIQKVKNIEPVIDDVGLLDEPVANVRAKLTDQEKMRKLLTYVNCETLAKNLVNALCKHEKGLMDTLLNS